MSFHKPVAQVQVAQHGNIGCTNNVSIQWTNLPDIRQDNQSQMIWSSAWKSVLLIFGEKHCKEYSGILLGQCLLFTLKASMLSKYVTLFYEQLTDKLSSERDLIQSYHAFFERKSHFPCPEDVFNKIYNRYWIHDFKCFVCNVMALTETLTVTM